MRVRPRLSCDALFFFPPSHPIQFFFAEKKTFSLFPAFLLRLSFQITDKDFFSFLRAQIGLCLLNCPKGAKSPAEGREEGRWEVRETHSEYPLGNSPPPQQKAFPLSFPSPFFLLPPFSYMCKKGCKAAAQILPVSKGQQEVFFFLSKWSASCRLQRWNQVCVLTCSYSATGTSPSSATPDPPPPPRPPPQ